MDPMLCDAGQCAAGLAAVHVTHQHCWGQHFQAILIVVSFAHAGAHLGLVELLQHRLAAIELRKVARLQCCAPRHTSHHTCAHTLSIRAYKVLHDRHQVTPFSCVAHLPSTQTRTNARMGLIHHRCERAADVLDCEVLADGLELFAGGAIVCMRQPALLYARQGLPQRMAPVSATCSPLMAGTCSVTAPYVKRPDADRFQRLRLCGS